MRNLLFLVAMLLFLGGRAQKENAYIMVLGIAQDGGYPHLGCKKDCCQNAWKSDSLKQNVVALALVNPQTKKWWLFEATPDISKQLQYFSEVTKGEYNYLPSGVFITHAHIGHYTGLIHFGREVSNTTNMPVFVMPKMKKYLETNGPWSQLVKLNNIELHALDSVAELIFDDDIKIKAFTVPHRDEFSETAGFKITTALKKYLFIPDVDKWQKWNKSIISEVKSVDYAFLDATFNDVNELEGRNMNEVPHPFVKETMELFKWEDENTKSKIIFIHFNHTNKLIRDKREQESLMKNNFKVAKQGATY